MNNGAFGENFPYSNFHDLNMDWIIKIAKDFLDQYTHIQEVISTGEDNLQNLTADGLEQLQTKADALEALLQQWYNTHSEDIQTELQTAIQNFITEAGRVGQEVIASIPQDYTELSNSVNYLNFLYESTMPMLLDYNEINYAQVEHQGYYIGHDGSIGPTAGTFAYAGPIPVSSDYQYQFEGYGTTIICAICSCDSNGNNRHEIYPYTLADTKEYFSYHPETNGYIMICYNYNKENRLASQDYTPSLKSLIKDISEISETNENIIDMTNLQLNTNWQNQPAEHRAIIDIPVLPNREYTIFFPENDKIVDNIAVIQMTNSSRVALKNDNVVENTLSHINTVYNAERICIQFNTGSFDATSAVFQNYNPVCCLGNYIITAVDQFSRNNATPWENKKLVWLGTSIPAGGRYDIDNPNSYPIMVGEYIGATVYNEAVGSSALHCKDPSRISQANPYGFMSNFEAVSRCITNSLTEMEWIINHYNDPNVFTENVPSSLSNEDKEFIRSCSWEIKLGKYFTENTFPDAWIIDHGHNDLPSVASEATYTAKTPISGTQHDGYYTNGTYVQSSASSYMEYDVSNELYVFISGTIGSWYDIYDIYDENGNNIGYQRTATEVTLDNYKVNVANASKIRISSPNTFISTIALNKLRYPYYNSLYSYNGGFDFIVNKILTYNPHARIIMIGEYENQKYPTISENQLIASERWELPLYKQWENLGLSQQMILVNGTYKSMLNIIIPDNLHPHTDQTGFALKMIAKNISLWLNSIG